MSNMDDSKAKRSANIVFYNIDKSELYPDGKLYSIRLVKLRKSGNAQRFVVATESLDKALDIAEEFLETGMVNG